MLPQRHAVVTFPWLGHITSAAPFGGAGPGALTGGLRQDHHGLSRDDAPKTAPGTAMRLTPLALAAALLAGLSACSGADGPTSRSGLSETFNTDNYRRSNDTNGTQTRPDVNRAYTQPSIPSIANRGF